MIPQATPLYGYAWTRDSDPDEEPDHVMVIGWEPEGDDGGFIEYRPVTVGLNVTGGGNAFALGDHWTWHLTADPELDDAEGHRIKFTWHQLQAAMRRPATS